MRRRHSTGTSVPTSKTQGELIELLRTWGVKQHAIGEQDGLVRIVFTLKDRQIRLELRVDCSDLPDPAFSGVAQPNGKVAPKRGWDGWDRATRAEYVTNQYAQREREAWRRLLLVTKARLEMSADIGVERVFLADILTMDGRTIYETIKDPLREMYVTGAPLALLPAAQK